MADLYPINIKVKFGSEVVTLPTLDDHVKTKSGVEIYIQKRQSDFRAWASIPDGTLEQHKHHRPIIQKCDWVEL
jgi:hypothetical protein